MRRLAETQLNKFTWVAALCICAIMTSAAHGQPDLDIRIPDGPAHPNRPYRVVYEAIWPDDPLDYAILPLETDPIDWGIIAIGEISAFVRDGLNVVSQTVEITPKEPGEFEMPELRIAYLHPEATPPAENAAPQTAPPDSGAPPSLRAEPFTITVRPARTWFWISGGLGVPFFVLLCWWFVRRSRRPQPAQGAPAAASLDAASVEQALQRARRCRLDCRFYEFYNELAQAAAALSASGSGRELAATLEQRAQHVGYTGERPTDDRMNGDLRDVERALARRKEEGEP